MENGKWKMEDLFKELLTKYELKEECRNYARDKDKGERTGIGLTSASALLVKMNNFCVLQWWALAL